MKETDANIESWILSNKAECLIGDYEDIDTFKSEV